MHRLTLFLLQELLEKLEKTEAKLAQTELDLQSEQNVRRTLQAEVVEAKDKESAMALQQVSCSSPDCISSSYSLFDAGKKAVCASAY
jgi:hypothetical protein